MQFTGSELVSILSGQSFPVDMVTASYRVMKTVSAADALGLCQGADNFVGLGHRKRIKAIKLSDDALAAHRSPPSDLGRLKFPDFEEMRTSEDGRKRYAEVWRGRTSRIPKGRYTGNGPGGGIGRLSTIGAAGRQSYPRSVPKA